jgi:LysM repeat protein
MSFSTFQSPNNRRLWLALGAAVLAATVAGCSGSKGKLPVASASTPANAYGWPGGATVKDAIALLNAGKTAEARQRLVAVLKVQAGDMIARNLLEQIDTDPKLLLGTQSYSYTVKQGETMSVLAQRFLGDPMKFYALARYNGIAVPTQIAPGQSILVPGRRPVAAVKKPAPKAAAVVKKPPQPVAAAKAAPLSPKPAARQANPALAARLRGQGLSALNAGSVNQAVALLRQALSLDPASGIIRGDLARALRIQSTVLAR